MPCCLAPAIAPNGSGDEKHPDLVTRAAGVVRTVLLELLVGGNKDVEHAPDLRLGFQRYYQSQSKRRL